MEGTHTQLQQLRYIIAIAEEQNITKAANKLFISQSAMSQQLIKVERELGTALFERVGRVLKLTKAGEIYVNSAKAILNVERAFYEEMEAQKKELSAVNVAVCSAVNGGIIEEMMEEVCRRLAGFDVNVTASDASDPEALNQLLYQGAADVVIGPEQQENNQELWTLERREESFAFVCAEQAQWGGKTLPAMLFPEDSYLRQKENEALRRNGIKVEVIGVTQVHSKAAVRSGLAGAFLRQSEAQDFPAACHTKASYTLSYSARLLRFGQIGEMLQQKI